MAIIGRRDTYVDWNDALYLQEVINQSKSRAEVLRRLDYCHTSPISRRKLNEAIRRLKLDTSNFSKSGRRAERWDILPSIIKDCKCIADVIRAVGLTDQGNQHKTAKRHIKRLGLDVSHFEECRKPGGSEAKLTDEEILCSESKVHRHTTRTRVLNKNLLGYKCARCGNLGEWMGGKLTLELNHKNGIHNDNRIDNLEFLCPNCHSQTETYGGKKQ